MGPLPMIYGSTIDAVARADRERSQLQQRRSEWAAQNLRSAAALHSQNRQQQFQNQLAQEARALDQAENDRRAEFAERQLRSTIFDRERDRLSRERIAGMQINEQADYRRQLKQMDIEARKEAAEAARKARDQELQWRKDEAARLAQHQSERLQVDSIARNIDRGRRYTGDQLDEMAQGVKDPMLRMQLEGLAEDARSLEFELFEEAQFKADELNERIAKTRSELEEARQRPTGRFSHWESTKKKAVANLENQLLQDIETARGTLPRGQEGLVRWDVRSQQFVPAVPPPSRRQPTAAGRQMLPTNDPAADPWLQMARDEQYAPGAAQPVATPSPMQPGAAAPPPQVLPPDMSGMEQAPVYARDPGYGSAPTPMPQMMIDPGYQEEAAASPYQYISTDSPPAGPASPFAGSAQQAAMIPPTPFEPPQRETPEQILARGGRPLDFTVDFPSGTGPGGMYLGGELSEFTPQDIRNYQNKLAEMRRMRAPDGSPLHSDEEAEMIAYDWVVQQKSAPFLGR
jgi:hypothetical protein